MKRFLSPRKIKFLEKIIRQKHQQFHLIEKLPKVVVEEMDGGMGGCDSCQAIQIED
jgi:hypothetical protein